MVLEYLVTSTLKVTQMWVNMPYIEYMGMIQNFWWQISKAGYRTNKKKTTLISFQSGPYVWPTCELWPPPKNPSIALDMMHAVAYSCTPIQEQCRRNNA
jgi:hypothetical protein